MQEAFDDYTEALAKAERFGGPTPWLDPYAATAPAEFFAVACEAYFINRTRFALEQPSPFARPTRHQRPDHGRTPRRLDADALKQNRIRFSGL
jgi:Mlc titration factor MtfA (ptsG expression regulator)